MKKIAFALYTYQLLSIQYVGGLPNTTKLEKKIYEAFDGEYSVTFQWESALKENEVEALVIPKPFPTVVNKTTIPEIYVPANLFYEMKVDEIKAIVDQFFSEV